MQPQSFQFLVDASEFQGSVYAALNNVVEDGKDCYDEFVGIVNEYIKDNSNSEINIDSRTKKNIMGFEERSSYASLDVVRGRVEHFACMKCVFSSALNVSNVL